MSLIKPHLLQDIVDVGRWVVLLIKMQPHFLSLGVNYFNTQFIETICHQFECEIFYKFLLKLIDDPLGTAFVLQFQVNVLPGPGYLLNWVFASKLIVNDENLVKVVRFYVDQWIYFLVFANFEPNSDLLSSKGRFLWVSHPVEPVFVDEGFESVHFYVN